MKKLAVCAFIILTGIFCTVFSKENIINEINLTNDNGAVVLSVDSKYKGEIKPSSDKKYFDIKNAKLSENFNADYMDKTSTASIVSQQIGSKVRIYVKGEETGNIITKNTAKEEKAPADVTKSIILALLITFVALKSYSATMKLASDIEDIKYPIREAETLNRRLMKVKKKPEIVLNTMTNTIKEDVYVDFQYAKDRKNIKIAI